MEEYRTALDHISVRSGTGVPTGGAEQALAALCRHGDTIWQFLDTFLADTNNGISNHSESTTTQPEGSEKIVEESLLRDQSGGEQLHSLAGGRAAEGQEQGRQSVDGQADTATGNVVAQSYSLFQLSAALSAFSGLHIGTDQGYTLGAHAVQDLTNFLYLEGQTEVLSVLLLIVWCSVCQ